MINLFIGGLKHDLRSELKIGKSSSLRKAFSLAKLYEAQWSFLKGGSGIASTINGEPVIKHLPTSTKVVPIVRKTLMVEER